MQIARNAAASVSQVLVGALILFVLYRAILEMLGVDRLGIWSVVLATASASRIGELGLSASVTRFVAKYQARGDNGAAGYAVQTAALSIAVLLAILLLPAYPLLDSLFERLFEGQALGEARALLPYALPSLVLTAVAGVFQSGLDGCQRYDWRALLAVSGQLLFLFLALWFTPRHGLVGLACAQIGQGLALVAAGWLLLRRVLPGLPWVPCEWRGESFREMLSYGFQFQLGAIGIMLFEPLTKALLVKYGGLSVAGYYQMASQFVGKARAFIVSANQVLVPVAAGLNERDPRRLLDLYCSNLRLLFFVILPLYALVAAWAPLLSELWIGQYESEFVFFAGVLALAMGLNTFAGPAYFCSLGTGRIRWNTAGHVWMGMANAGLGLVLGPCYGAAGIAWGMAAALVSSSALVVIGFHRGQHFSWRLLLPREAIGLVVSCLSLVLGEYYAYHALVGEPAIIRLLICISLPLPILGPALWCHPLRYIVQGRIRSILVRGAVPG